MIETPGAKIRENFGKSIHPSPGGGRGREGVVMGRERVVMGRGSNHARVHWGPRQGVRHVKAVKNVSRAARSKFWLYTSRRNSIQFISLFHFTQSNTMCTVFQNYLCHHYSVHTICLFSVILFMISFLLIRMSCRNSC